MPCLATGLRMFDRGDRQSVLTGSPRQECLRSGMADVLPGGLPDPEPHTSDTLILPGTSRVCNERSFFSTFMSFRG